MIVLLRPFQIVLEGSEDVFMLASITEEAVGPDALVPFKVVLKIIELGGIACESCFG